MSPRPRRAAGVLVALLSLVVLTSCASPGPTRAENRSAPPRGETATQTSSAPAVDTQVGKLLVFVVENHSLKQMRRGMPYVSRLANRYGYAKRYYGVTHPSLPNYLAIAGGDTFGIADDDPPSSHPISGPSVFGKAVRGGSTATLYAEGMTSRCQRESAGRYAVKHNPWAYFSDEGRLCRRNDVPLRRFAGDVEAGDLPAVGMVIADMCNIAHDCTLRRADTWLKKRIRQVFHGPDWASGQLAVVITADEDDYRSGNKVLTVVAHPSLSHKLVKGRLTHYSLSRSYAEVAGVTPLRKADGARSLLRRFGLTTG